VTERDLEALQAAWAALPPNAPGPECTPPEAIWDAVAGNRSEREVQAMLAHSLGCADCSALWRLAHDLRGASERSSAPSAVIPLRRPAPVRWLIGAGALVAALLALMLVPRGGPRETSPVVRGTEVAVLRADPETASVDRAHAVLRWMGAPEGSRYTVVVSTRDLTVLFRKSGLVASQLELPPETLSTVPPGEEIVWRVEAITPGGRRISSGAFLSRLR